MNIAIRQQGQITVATVQENRLDASSAPDFKIGMAELVDQGVTTVVIDLAQVEFIDSSGLGAIIAMLKRLNKQGDLKIVGVHGMVRDLFKLTRMDRVFKLYDSVDQALS